VIMRRSSCSSCYRTDVFIFQALEDETDILDTFGIFGSKWVDWKEDGEQLLMVATVRKALEPVCEPKRARGGDEDRELGDPEGLSRVIRDGNFIFHGCHFAR
jgi:hypothetical protein